MAILVVKEITGSTIILNTDGILCANAGVFRRETPCVWVNFLRQDRTAQPIAGTIDEFSELVTREINRQLGRK